MDKINNFFGKNYDYYIIVGLIIFSFIISMLNYYEIFVDSDAVGFYYNIPCFLREQEHFIEWASLDIEDLIQINVKSLDLIFLNYGVLIKLLLENIIGAILIFGLYFAGKKLYFKYRKNWLQILLTISLLLYIIVIVVAAIILPIQGCIIRFG